MSGYPNPFLNNSMVSGSNFVGEYRSRYSTGETIKYNSGDMVLFEGKLFVATNLIESGTPDTNSDWLAMGNSRISYRSTTPTNPQIGDNWFNSATGKLYKYIDDGETKQFVEV